MKCTIIHESQKRLRLHLHCGRMTLHQADLLEYYLQTLDGVQKVQVFDRTQDVVLHYQHSRQAVLRALSAFSFQRAETMDLLPEHTSRALNREFEDKLTGLCLRRAVSKLFLPPPVTAALSVFRSIRYIRDGLDALLHGKLSVAVLDAAAVTTSLCRGDFATAGSIMFMLKLGETLEEWTHKKSVADLAESMSLHVEQVWLCSGDTEVLVPVRSVQPGDQIMVRTGSVIPLDGKVLSGEAMVNQSSMTGEPLPVLKKAGATSMPGQSWRTAAAWFPWRRPAAAGTTTRSFG